MDLTVAICTYRRADLLQRTLESLASCKSIDATWELLLIDNAGEKEVEALASNFTDELPLRYIVEDTTGTSNARNRAVQEAAAPIVLFTDDDVTFDAHWLRNEWHAITQNSDCAFWGGRVDPVWETPKPSWFNPSHFQMLGDTIVQYNEGDASRQWKADADPPFYTANLAFRIDAINSVGGFDTTVGHCGDIRMGMEDSLMVKNIAAAGGAGWYAADALVYHPVPVERTRKPFARQFVWRQGWLSAEMTRRRIGDGYGQAGSMPKWFYRVAITEWFKGLGGFIAGLFRFDAARRFCGQLQMRFNTSRIMHGLRKKRQAG